MNSNIFLVLIGSKKKFTSREVRGDVEKAKKSIKVLEMEKQELLYVLNAILSIRGLSASSQQVMEKSLDEVKPILKKYDTQIRLVSKPLILQPSWDEKLIGTIAPDNADTQTLQKETRTEERQENQESQESQEQPKSNIDLGIRQRAKKN